MRNTLILMGLVSLVLASPIEASAKTTRGAKSASITELDIRVCMGIAGADAPTQVQACTKIINSGKVKHPHESEYYAYRAGAFLVLEKNSEALADMNKAVSLVDKPEFRFQRAVAYMANDNLDAAMNDLDKVIAAKSDFAAAYFMRGVIHYRNAEFKQAVPEFDKAASLIPTYYQAIFARGAARMRADETDAGKADVKTARRMSVHADADMAKLGISAP
jgi:tetratricopeptide (TPR) repeat protein